MNPFSTVLQFPNHRSIGQVRVWNQRAGSWEPLAQARWQVMIPVDVPACLWCESDVSPSDLTPLASAPPDAFEGLVMMAPLIGDAGLWAIEHLNGLEVLGLHGSEVTDLGLSTLGRLSRLGWLDLSGCPVTNAGIEELLALNTINTLDLSNTLVSDSVMPVLAAMPALQRLNISQTYVTNDGLSMLLASASLKALSVDTSSVTIDGIAELWSERPDIELVAS